MSDQLQGYQSVHLRSTGDYECFTCDNRYNEGEKARRPPKKNGFACGGSILKFSILLVYHHCSMGQYLQFNQAAQVVDGTSIRAVAKGLLLSPSTVSMAQNTC